MEPKKVGRTLGIGVRVASNMVRERLEQNARNAQAAASRPPEARSSPKAVPPGPKLVDRATNARRGIRAFGHALVTPFTHAGSILWLEITGLFFGLFAVFFAQNIYRLRGAWHQPGEQQHLWLYVVLGLGFGWFSATSFVRARQKTKQGPRVRK